jgi:hypothetical protein
MNITTLRIGAPLNENDSLGEAVRISRGEGWKDGMVVGRRDRSTLLLSMDEDPWYQRIRQRVPVILTTCVLREIRDTWHHVRYLLSP